MAIKETIWKIKPHTEAKHTILREYLKAWLPIMSKWNGRILYIDGFAGPGKYLDENGQPNIDGSPLIAISAAIKHRLPLNAEIVFIFIEANPKRFKYLKNLLSEITLPDNMKYEVECSKFDETLLSILNDLDEQKKQLAPTFAFIDPFGYSDTPFSIVKRIMENRKCEVLINFMYSDVNRFLGDPIKAMHFDSLFGTDEWRRIAELKDSRDRKMKIRNLYQKQLREVAVIKYARYFEMINKFNQTEYFLFFGTNNLEGLRQMNTAMWKVDTKGTFRFSDRTNPNQIVFFAPEPDYNLLKRLIIKEFRYKTVPVEYIDEFVLVSGFTHFKKDILRPMEYAIPPVIKVIGGTERRRGTYPPSTYIKFL